MPKKIAFIHPDLGIGGAERLVLDVASALSKQGNEVFFITNHFDKTHAFEELKNDDFQVQIYGDWLPRSFFGKFQALCAYVRMIYLTSIYCLMYRNEDKPDMYFVDLIPVAVPILKWFNEKVIYYCHHPDLLSSTPGGPLKKLYRKPINWLEYKSTGQADVLLVNSEYTASVFRQTFPEIKKSIQVVYPTVAYSFQEAIEKITNPRPVNQIIPEVTTRPQYVFLSVNRFHPAKKLELAILAMEKLKESTSEEQWNQILLIMAGGYDPISTVNAEYFAKLEKLTKEKGLDDKVIFMKSPSDDIKTELLLSCGCVIYTPVNEHFGIVPLEAMTVSKPVIACNSGGPRETVQHGKTGYLCEPNPESMARCMYKMLHVSKAQEMGNKGRKVLEDKFSYYNFSNCLADVINVNKKRI